MIFYLWGNVFWPSSASSFSFKLFLFELANNHIYSNLLILQIEKSVLFDSTCRRVSNTEIEGKGEDREKGDLVWTEVMWDRTGYSNQLLYGMEHLMKEIIHNISILQNGDDKMSGCMLYLEMLTAGTHENDDEITKIMMIF